MKRIVLLIALLIVLSPQSLVAVTAQSTITSAKSGNWSAGSTWTGGIVPNGQQVTIASGHVVTLNTSPTVAGVTVNGELLFTPLTSTTLQSSGNVIVNGTLRMKPSAPTVVHTLRFININESAFVGGGMVPLATDVGLWVMGNGKLDILGSAKTAWTHAAGSIAQNSAQVTLEAAPVGWRVGDAIAIAPTSLPSVGTDFWNGFSASAITAINGATITLNTPTPYPHPSVSNPFTNTVYTAEVMNFSRNVHIEGTANGRSHIFIHSTQPQTIRYAELRYLAPGALGRYGIHFHLSGDGSRGTLVDAVVIRDTGNHAFVPHASHGISFLNTIAYRTSNDAYWWDSPSCNTCEDTNDSHDITIDHAVAAKIFTLAGDRGTRMAGFVLGKGNNNVLRNSVAVGVQGEVDSAGIVWPEIGHGVWLVVNNTVHNNKNNGSFAWQNNGLSHVVNGLVAYRNETGIDHGAYRNGYQYLDTYLIGNTIALNSRASSGGPIQPDNYGHSFRRIYADTDLRIGEHNLPYQRPTLLIDCIFPSIRINEQAKTTPGQYDIVNCTKPDGASIEPGDFIFEFAWLASRYRVQRADGTAYQIAGAQTVTTIAPFYAGVP